jgi:nucleolar protein 53
LEVPDEQLFKEDKKPIVSEIQARKLRAQEPSKCFIGLENVSKVAPLLKSKKCKDPEAKKHPLVRAKLQRDKEMGIIRPRLLQSLSDRIAAGKKVAKTKIKKIDFNRDLWDEKNETPETNEDVPMQSEWMHEKLKQYHLKNLGEDEVKVPQITHEKRSQRKVIEIEAGTSYNPHNEDLKILIDNVVKKEEDVIKKEQKLNRALKPLYQKYTKSEVKRRRRDEMRQGFPINSNDEDDVDEESDTEYKTLNPPVRNKKKDLKQRRKQKENKLRQAQRAMDKQELSKLKDLGA